MGNINNAGIVILVGLMPPSQLKRQVMSSEGWDKCGVVQFLSGRGYAIDYSGKTWDVGSQESVLEAFKTGQVSETLCPDHRGALELALEIRESEGYGYKPKVERNSNPRSRPSGDVKHREAATRRVATQKRISLRKTK